MSDRCGLKDVMDSSCAFCIVLLLLPAYAQNVSARTVTDNTGEESDRHDGRMRRDLWAATTRTIGIGAA
jgi:hypothetical protein